MMDINSIIKISEELGWTVKPFKENNSYRFSKPMKNNKVFFNKNIYAKSAEEMVNELLQEYADFDLPLETSCWQDDQGLPLKETHYKSVNELNEAFKGFKTDLFKLFITIANLYIDNNEIEKITNF